MGILFFYLKKIFLENRKFKFYFTCLTGEFELPICAKLVYYLMK